MAINWEAGRQEKSCPPVYSPGVFSRSDAKEISFAETERVGNIDITLRKEGGLVVEGTVRDEAGKPVPEAFVVVHHCDMLFDFVTAYTDAQGHYRIQGLGDGECLVHVDAAHRGLVRMRTPLKLDKGTQTVQRDFTLPQGVTISGKFVDEEGKDWKIAESFGFANIKKEESDPTKTCHSFSLTCFGNRFRPKNVQRGWAGSFALGEGPYDGADMIFVTKSTFVIPGMQPGNTILSLLPNKEGQKVVKILYNGQDVMESGIETKPGEEIKDVTIVIGKQ
jgi:hypothetical protein